MNPEADVGSVTKGPKMKRVFQRRLHDQLSESRMLKVLDRSLQNGRRENIGKKHLASGWGNQEQEEQELNSERDEEEELVCVSTMVNVAELEPAVPESYQAGGVLKTVRFIHNQRAVQGRQQENQAEH